jgi:LPXTG-site transpeptidase (sortase) family protein
MVTRRRALVAAVAGTLLVLAAGTYVRARPAGHPMATVATPATIISTLPTTAPAPAPAPVSHDGMRIVLPELGIDLPVVEGDGYNAPLYKAVHYPGTSWPGDGGRTVMYAHARVGMFGPLFGARVGQRIRVTRPDGVVWTYAITEYYPRWPVGDLRWLRAGDHEQIVLITCTTYAYNDPRIIAVGEQVGGPPPPPPPTPPSHRPRPVLDS